MFNISLPNITINDCYSACIDEINNPERRAAFDLLKSRVLEADGIYQSLALSGNLYLYNPFSILDGVDITPIKELYSDYMVGSKKRAREIYNLIKASVQICPLCGLQTVSSLDHHLPKSKFPIFAVSPANLIPACTDCNKNKGTKYALEYDEQTIHPYFDEIDNFRWLYARVERSNPPVCTFFVDPPFELFPQKKRLESHMDMFNLNGMYSTNAAAEIAEMSFLIKEIHSKYGPIEVKNYLLDVANSRYKSNKNSWKAALYFALAESDWFCEVGCTEM